MTKKKINSIATLYLSVPDRSEGATLQSGCRHCSFACVLCSRQKKLLQSSVLPEVITLLDASSPQQQQQHMEKLSSHNWYTDTQVTIQSAKSPTGSLLFQCETPALPNLGTDTSLKRKMMSSAKASHQQMRTLQQPQQHKHKDSKKSF